jgi:hypothetical protein
MQLPCAFDQVCFQAGYRLPHVSLIFASNFHFGRGILLHFAFSSLTRDTESSFDSVKCIGFDSRPRNETSDAHIPGSDLTPYPTEGSSYFQLSFHFGMEFMLHCTFLGILTRVRVLSSALDWMGLVPSIETPTSTLVYPEYASTSRQPLACNFNSEGRS